MLHKTALTHMAAGLAAVLMSGILGCQPSADMETPPDVQIDATAWGCGPDSDVHTAWLRSKAELVSKDRTLPLERFHELQRVVLESPRLEAESPEDILGRLGIDRDSLRAHRDEILSAALDGMESDLVVPEDILDRHLAWTNLRDKLLLECLGRRWQGTEGYRMEVTIRGDPVIRLHSSGWRPGMLPWDIDTGRQKWTSADVRISEILAEFLDPHKVPNKLVCETGYWQEGFWRERMVWRSLVGSSIVADLSEQFCRTLAHWELVEQRFKVGRVDLGEISSRPISLYCELSASSPSSVDEVQWWNPIKDGRPEYDWGDLYDLWERAGNTVNRERWVLEWKQVDTGRSVCLSMEGLLGAVKEGERDAARKVWRHAGMGGPIEFKLLLLRGRSLAAIAYCSGQEAGSVVVVARSQEGGRHWLDSESLDSRRSSAGMTYLFVGPDGVPSKRSAE